MWIPDPSIEGMSKCPIPPTIPSEASPWVFKRQTSAEFIKDRSDVYCEDFPEKNMIMGDPCYPKQIGACECGGPRRLFHFCAGLYLEHVLVP
jgi:hypothetical protein